MNLGPTSHVSRRTKNRANPGSLVVGAPSTPTGGPNQKSLWWTGGAMWRRLTRNVGEGGRRALRWNGGEGNSGSAERSGGPVMTRGLEGRGGHMACAQYGLGWGGQLGTPNGTAGWWVELARHGPRRAAGRRSRACPADAGNRRGSGERPRPSQWNVSCRVASSCSLWYLGITGPRGPRPPAVGSTREGADPPKSQSGIGMASSCR